MIKHYLLCPALLIAFSTLPSQAETTAATWVVGDNTWPVEITTTQLCPGVKYTFVDWKVNRSSKLPGSHLFVIEADMTHPDVTAQIIRPDKISGYQSLTAHAKLAHKPGNQIVAGANANFGIVSADAGSYACMGQQPYGICVSNGVMYTDMNVGSFMFMAGPETYTGMLAIDENDKVYIDYTAPQKANNGIGSGVQFAAILKKTNARWPLDMCNRWVADQTASIFTRQYGTSKVFRVGDKDASSWTQTKGSGRYIEVILDYAEGTTAMNQGGLTDYVVKEMRIDPETFGTLGDHDLAIVARGSRATDIANSWNEGDVVQLDTKINFKSMGSPNKILNATSGNILAMKNGVLTDGLQSESYNTNPYPRTLYATNADGSKLWILTCEQNAAKSNTMYGFSTAQMCIMARDYFGATNAMQCDCGGSSQMYANGKQVCRSYDNTAGVRNVYNGFFVVYTGNEVTMPSPGSGETPVDPEPDPDDGWTDSGKRAHYAYNLHTVEGTDAPTLAYSLTGAVKSTEVLFTNRNNPADVVTVEGGTAEGLNTLRITDSRLTPGATYDWAVTVNSHPVPATSHFFHDAPATLDARGGVGIVTDPESPAFGKIITSMGCAQGFGLYNPDLTKAGTYHAAMSPWVPSNPSSTYRIAMRDRRVAYACDYSDGGAGYWRFDPENPTTTPENLIGGANDGTGCFKMPGSTVCVGSGATGIGFQGSGADTKLWVFAEDWPTGNSATKGILTRWDIGTSDKITTAANASYNQYTGQKTFAHRNVSITGTPDGVFVVQRRSKGNNSTGVPVFVYTDVNGTMIYSGGNHPELFNSCGGSVAISDDLSLLAVPGDNENIKIFDVTWSGNTPSFKYKAMVNGTHYWAETSQIAFDPAGNLFTWQRSTDQQYAGLFGYSYKNDNPSATTPARADYAIVAVDPAGIDAITVDKVGESTYYNLQGIRVDAANLTPGVYIKVTGNKKEKIIVTR